jgi:hypothetical protein
MTLPRSSGRRAKVFADWPYADTYDEVMAADEAHHVRYEDDHIRLVEVAYFPGIQTEMHGCPFPVVIARDAPEPKVTDVLLEPNGKMNGQGAGYAPPPNGMEYPVGITMAPLAPRAVKNNDTFPLHYYKVEFKRFDGPGDGEFSKLWKTYYPWMLDPLKPVVDIDPRDATLGPPISEEYPFPAASESYIAAPNNHYVRYQSDHIVFLEVVVRPGERENVHGHADRSVFARDVSYSPGASSDWKLDPNGINGQGGGFGAAPAGLESPRCSTMGPQWPHAVCCHSDFPLHFYRIQFKRIDGDGIRTHWREWYPWIAKLADDH